MDYHDFWVCPQHLFPYVEVVIKRGIKVATLVFVYAYLSMFSVLATRLLFMFWSDNQMEQCSQFFLVQGYDR